MIYTFIYLIVGVSSFVCGIVALVFYYRFYKKYTRQLAEAFDLLRQKQLVDIDDYYFFQQLGVPGFGYRVSLISKLLKGKRFQIAKNRWAEAEASQLLLSTYDFLWLKKIYKAIYIMGGVLLIWVIMYIVKP